MPIGAMLITNKLIQGTAQPIYLDEISLVGDNSYPTGGMTGVQAALRALTADQREIVDVRSIGPNGGYMPVWDKANGKLLCYVCAGAATPPAEVANATNLSAVTFRFVVTSK